MSVANQLLELEQQFWTGGPESYRANLDDRCLCAFTEMAGVMDREEIAATVADQPRWTDVVLQQQGFLEVDDNVAVLTYEANARRPGGDHYRALVSSGYVRRSGDWKMAFHQQTPLPTA